MKEAVLSNQMNGKPVQAAFWPHYSKLLCGRGRPRYFHSFFPQFRVKCPYCQGTMEVVGGGGLDGSEQKTIFKVIMCAIFQSFETVF